MSFISHSPKPVEYSSVRWCESRTMPGVTFCNSPNIAAAANRSDQENTRAKPAG